MMENKSMKKKCKVVMISTDIAENAILIFNGRNKFAEYHKQFFTQQYLKSMGEHGCNSFHLYILSEDEIKEGDHVVATYKANNTEHTSVWQYSKAPCPMPYWGNPNACKKIIATTDSSLKFHLTYKSSADSPRYLPSISQSFVDRFVSEYNKGNKIEEVMVEYVNNYDVVERLSDYEDTKLNPDNTINISTIKDSFTILEIQNALHKIEIEENKQYISLWNKLQQNLGLI